MASGPTSSLRHQAWKRPRSRPQTRGRFLLRAAACAAMLRGAEPARVGWPVRPAACTATTARQRQATVGHFAKTSFSPL